MVNKDEGEYTCRQYPPSEQFVDTAWYDLKLKTGPTYTSTSNPTVADHTVKAAGPLVLGVAVGTVVLLTVALVLLICWCRRRGNKTPEDTTIGLSSVSDDQPLRGPGASHDEPTTSQSLSAEGHPDGGLMYASIVLTEGQRTVDPWQQVTYASVRAPPGHGESLGDLAVHDRHRQQAAKIT
ncbi:hypothetical protein NHX12_026176 [Muraenolepis orangiensis]|uniref:Uncharacterized protein n=1 Tax=Muraenolepis orangiensis TaxID=630683 RepID=A0A9Q0IN18_9TELE|nr:hypothetical protein NHX12_026176 [Muraenolepis orangiensis]